MKPISAWQPAFILGAVYTSILTLSLCAHSAVAGDAAMPADKALQSESNARPTLIEEIEIIGQRPLHLLRQEIRDNEQAMFALFNELNSSDDFDVDCAMVTHTGTRIPTWECDVGYLKKARMQDVQDFLNFGVPMRSEAELYGQFQDKSEELNAEMQALARQHPELAEAMITLHARKQRLEAVKKQQKGFLGGFPGRLAGTGQD